MTKILFFIESLTGGGAEKVLCNLVNNMNQEKFDITVQTVYPDAGASNLKQGIHYRYMYSHNDRWNTIRYRLEAHTSLAYQLHIKSDYDIEVAYLECGSTKIMAGSTNKNAKKAAWVHCDMLHAYGDHAEDFVRKTKKWYDRYDAVVCVSQQVKDSFEALFGNSNPTYVIYNTVNSEDILIKSNAALPAEITKNRPAVLFTGRLASPKNVMRLVRAHRQILEHGVDHEIWIIGEGPDRKEVEEYVTENHLENSVKLFGYQTNPYCFMKAADILVCTSDYEGFSTSVTEGLILGKPIVTTDVSGMRELLGNSEYGIITQIDDNDFAGRLQETLRGGQKEFDRLSALSAERGKKFVTSVLVQDTERFLKQL